MKEVSEVNEQKSLLLEIAEAIDRRLRQHTPRDEGPPEARRPRWLRWLGRQMVPNIGTLLMVAVLLLTVPSLAAPLRAPAATSTSTISYQGRLADSSGNPLTGKYNLEFRIYDVPMGGVPLWTEMWTGGNAVDVSDGLFNVMLGSIDNTLAVAIEGYDELYLGITVGTDGEMEPRVQLGSVPFSMQAMTVPDGSITTEKIADGAVTARKLALPFAQYRSYDGFSTTSSNFVPIPVAKVIVDLDTASKLLIIFAGDISVDRQGSAVEVTVTIDSQFISPAAIIYANASANTRITGSQSMIVEAGPGSHVIRLDLRSYDGVATATIGHRSLSVLAFH
jgi:hypothetical protein